MINWIKQFVSARRFSSDQLASEYQRGLRDGFVIANNPKHEEVVQVSYEGGKQVALFEMESIKNDE